MSPDRVLSKDSVVEGQTVYVFRLPRAMFRNGARFLNEYCSDDPWCLNTYTLFLFFCEWVQKLSTCATSRNAQNRGVTSSKPALSVFLEVVEQEERQQQGTSSYGYKHPSMFSSLNELRAARTSKHFLPNMPECGVSEYRFWVFLREDLAELDAMAKVVQEANAESKLRAKRAMAGGKPLSPLPPYKLWMKLSRPDILSQAFDNYNFRKRCTLPEMQHRIWLPFLNNTGAGGRQSSSRRLAALLEGSPQHCSPTGFGSRSMEPDAGEFESSMEPGTGEEQLSHTEGDCGNLLHPKHNFSAFDVFQFELDCSEDSACVCRVQSDISEYLQGREWTFPKPKNVLRLQAAQLRPDSVYNKYLPDVQKSFIFVVSQQVLAAAAADKRTELDPASSSSIIEAAAAQATASPGSYSRALRRNSRVLGTRCRDFPASFCAFMDSRSLLDAAEDSSNSPPPPPPSCRQAQNGADGYSEAARNWSLFKIGQTEMGQHNSDLRTQLLSEADTVGVQQGARDGSSEVGEVMSAPRQVLDPGSALGLDGTDDSCLTRIRLFSERDLATIAGYREGEGSAGEADYRQALLEHQAWVLHEFKTAVLHSSSKLSRAGRALVNFMLGEAGNVEAESSLLSTPRKLTVCDHRLDVTGNWIAARMECFENLLLVHSAHKHFFLLSLGQMDAYRYDFGLHMNAFAIGKSATSKSYVFDLMERCSVPGTIVTITYQSLKADASDTVDQNDDVTIMNEVALCNFVERDNGSGGTNAETMMKEKLTSQKVRAKVLDIKDNGQRETKFTESECIGCWFGATNDDPSVLSESFASRFHWAMYTMTLRKERHIVMLADAESRLNSQERNIMDYHISWFQQMQCLHYLVEKLIMCGGLTDVSLTTTHTIINHIDAALRERNIETHARTFKRMCILVRLITIHTALYYLYFVPGVKLLHPVSMKLVQNFYGKPFRVEQLQFLDMYLRDEESAVMFVLGLISDQIVNPIEDILRNLLRELHDKQRSPIRRYKSTRMLVEDTVVAGQADQSARSAAEPSHSFYITQRQQWQRGDEHANSVLQSARIAADCLSPPKDHDNNDGESEENSLEELLLEASRKGPSPHARPRAQRYQPYQQQDRRLVTVYDYSYLRISMPADSVPKYIDGAYSGASKPSECQVRTVWKAMRERASFLNVYKENPDGAHLFPVLDESLKGMPKYGRAIEIRDDHFYIHASLLSSSGGNKSSAILRSVIQEVMHKHTRERPVLYGEQPAEGFPNLFSRLQLTPCETNVLKTPNTLYMNEMAKNMLQSVKSKPHGTAVSTVDAVSEVEQQSFTYWRTSSSSSSQPSSKQLQ